MATVVNNKIATFVFRWEGKELTVKSRPPAYALRDSLRAINAKQKNQSIKILGSIPLALLKNEPLEQAEAARKIMEEGEEKFDEVMKGLEDFEGLQDRIDLEMMFEVIDKSKAIEGDVIWDEILAGVYDEKGNVREFWGELDPGEVEEFIARFRP